MKCNHCEFYDKSTNICKVDGGYIKYPGLDTMCDYLEDTLTVFDSITKSHETLAEKLVFPLADGWWMSTIIDDGTRFATREYAVAATLDKLKEVEE